jgi:hypothetical protein
MRLARSAPEKLWALIHNVRNQAINVSRPGARLAVGGCLTLFMERAYARGDILCGDIRRLRHQRIGSRVLDSGCVTA